MNCGILGCSYDYISKLYMKIQASTQLLIQSKRELLIQEFQTYNSLVATE